MRHALIRISAAVMLANSLAAAIVWACGPYYVGLPTVTSIEPADLAAFDRGELGVVRPRFRRATLVTAYRVLSGTPPLRVNYDTPSVGAGSGISWVAIRDNVPGTSGATNVAPRTRRIIDYVTPINCLQDAYDTASRTFEQRQSQFGADSAPLRAWVRAQAAVFANCEEEPLSLPEPAAADADPLTKADRAYQTAAAYFYGMQYRRSRTPLPRDC